MRLLEVLIGLATVVLGVVVFVYPALASLTLIVVLAMAFWLMGILRIGFGLFRRLLPG